MAISTGKHQKDRTHVYEIYVNSEEVGEILDAWYNENEYKYEILDVKISSCYFGEKQSKTVVLIFYRIKEK